VSRRTSAAVTNIAVDIADILGSEMSVIIDIGKGDIDPALLPSVHSEADFSSYSSAKSTISDEQLYN